VLGCCSSRRPSIGARLARPGRIDSPKAIGHAIDLERIAINHTGRLSEGGRGSEREGAARVGSFIGLDSGAAPVSRLPCQDSPVGVIATVLVNCCVAPNSSFTIPYRTQPNYVLS
jgi:hypothetical protein